MKKILGLDLGTASIGWAFVNEAENAQEKSVVQDIFLDRRVSKWRKIGTMVLQMHEFQRFWG